MIILHLAGAFDPTQALRRWARIDPAPRVLIPLMDWSRGTGMNRRETIIALVALGAASLAAQAQQASRIVRIGYVAGDLRRGARHLFEAFLQGMRELGYVEGRSLVIE